jgi:hypothetical protein
VEDDLGPRRVADDLFQDRNFVIVVELHSKFVAENRINDVFLSRQIFSVQTFKFYLDYVRRVGAVFWRRRLFRRVRRRLERFVDVPVVTLCFYARRKRLEASRAFRRGVTRSDVVG